jgi:Zn-dependent metalloprotease/subtilisin-like proprotein convertase family protein
MSLGFVLGAAAQPVDAGAAGSTTVAQTSAEQALVKQSSGVVHMQADVTTGGKGMVRVDRGGDLMPNVAAPFTPAAKADAFLKEHGSVFGIKSARSELVRTDSRVDQLGHSRISYQQKYQGVPVFGGVLRGHVDAQGRLTAINGTFVQELNLSVVPKIAASAAQATAVRAVEAQQPSVFKAVELTAKPATRMVYRTNLTRGTPGENHLVYEVEVTNGASIREFVYVDAHNGKIVDQITGIHSLKERRIYEAVFDPADPDVPPPAWQEGDLRPALDPAHEDEVSGAGYSYNLFFNLSNGSYRSWDEADATMFTVNNDPTIMCPNANWNGTSTNYCTGTSADDVVAHEWTHAYTQETSGLIYQWQSGALNESFSDIFGETIDLLNNRETLAGNPTGTLGNNGPRSQDDSVCSEFTSEVPTDDDSIRWLMGEDAFAFAPLPPVGDAAIRDMWHPACAGGELLVGDPGHVGEGSNYSCSSGDAGGVHTNSGVPNRAYALLVDGDTVTLRDDGTAFPNPVTVTGIGLTKAAHIHWRANSEYNGPATNFIGNADSLEMACDDLIGVNLTKLVTTPEVGTGGPLGLGPENNDTIDPTPELSGEIITAGDCVQVANAIAAVEMRTDVTKQCGFKAMLDPAPAPRCGAAEVETYFSETWEGGQPAGWTTGQQPVTKAQLDTLEWFLRSGDLPADPDGSPHAGSAMFQENRRDLGNCSTDDESGTLWLESPAIVVDADDPSHLVFEHFVNTEVGFDGGNVQLSINGNPYDVIPGSAYSFNPYPGTLTSTADGNTNPKAGEEAFHGGNPGTVAGSWGESQIDLEAAGVSPGDSIRLRWDFGQDGCNGNEGWYLDNVELFTCGAEIPQPGKVCTAYPATIDPLGSQILSLLSSVTMATVSGETPPTDVNVRDLEGSHTWMGDLTFELESPQGTSITLFDGAACGSEDGISAEFDDDAAAVIGCNDWLSGGTFKPFEALAAFNGEDPNGDWTLTITDGFPQDEGTLESWTVEFCADDSDGDGIVDTEDNCTLVPNPTQCDTNGDFFGNHCDADLDNNNIVNTIDLGMLRNEFGSTAPDNDADLDCNGVVNQIDLGMMRNDLGEAPGPSGTTP